MDLERIKHDVKLADAIKSAYYKLKMPVEDISSLMKLDIQAVAQFLDTIEKPSVTANNWYTLHKEASDASWTKWECSRTHLYILAPIMDGKVVGDYEVFNHEGNYLDQSITWEGAIKIAKDYDSSCQISRLGKKMPDDFA